MSDVLISVFVPLRFCLECAPLRAPEAQFFLERAPLHAPGLWSALRAPGTENNLERIPLRKSANVQVKFVFEKFQENFSKNAIKMDEGVRTNTA